ncbi:threonine ammonia-lyase [Mitsuokella jalaludinii]|uniref:L-threonine dehydratase catabolic TdcB n=4 Tax=Mitsuokella TaxID=52225 RepID=A0A173YIG2_9FIRM|nr:threonine ammonia-lyase [Mitsuokella jalaludinii]MCB5724618.1 threonine ammonia-lyase [Mitsuokella jalaludinii]MCQ1532769.1 threonine ammonia-lyase [Mitsuokella jalaludinii]MEE0481835.1 threonine ammonia-lyase [Mitsuokella jalaludinii]CUN63734.1 L-threonine dehydratase catabolic TdcB [Mitsuokella jalaludinii]
MPEEKKSSKRSNAEIVESTTIADVYRAAKQLEGVARKTRLIHSDYFSELCHNDVYLKPENLQHTGAFKLRGAYNKISQLTPEERVRGVITASAGNHAQGVAYAARKLGVKAVICMPATTPILKVEGTRALGAEVVLHGDGFDDAYAHSLELQKKHGYVYIHPFNDLQVLLGQGTTALEIIDALKDVDAILCPIGGGGFASGVALATKLVNPNVKVIGVEPENAACMKAALAADKVVTLDSADTVADGCAVKTAGTLTFEFCKKYLDDIITVSEIDIMNALLSLIEKHKLVAEGAGVLSLAALAKLPFHDKKVVSIISGGNIDISTISALIDKALIARGRVFCFAVQLPDKPGQLLNVSRILAEENANVIKLDHDQTKVTDSFKKVVLTVTVETHNEQHIQKIIQALNANGYEIQKIY